MANWIKSGMRLASPGSSHSFGLNKPDADPASPRGTSAATLDGSPAYASGQAVVESEFDTTGADILSFLDNQTLSVAAIAVGV